MAAPAISVPRWFKVSLWLHRWTGLVATPFFLVLCLTGSVLIFHTEVDRWLGDVPAAGPAPAHPLSVARLAELAAARAPGLAPQFVSVSPETPDQATVSLAPPGEARLDKGAPQLLDRASGRPLTFTNPGATFTGTLLKLHSQWFAGVPGEVAGSGLALLALIAIVTGIVVYAPFVRRLPFGIVRADRGERVRQLDLHNLVGAVVAGWVLVVAATGVALGLGSLALGLWQNTELRGMAGGGAAVAASARISPDRALETALEATPGRDPQFVIWPGTEFSSPRHFTVLMYGRQPWNERLFDIVLVDARDGRLAAKRPLPPYLQTVVLAGPLHFGDYGGLPLKLFWLANAWSAFFITANGAWLWWAKRRRRATRPASAQAAVA